jgi:hypothetical protein
MTKQTRTSAEGAEGRLTKQPSLIAYAVREFGGGESPGKTWTRLGAAWANKDGKGFNLMLEALPITGRIVLRINEPHEAQSD